MDLNQIAIITGNVKTLVQHLKMKDGNSTVGGGNDDDDDGDEDDDGGGGDGVKDNR